MKVKLDEGAFLPERAHPTDAGLDLRTPIDFVCPSWLCFWKPKAVIDTRVHIAIPEGHVGFLKSKSGLNVKNDLTGEGVIDAGYTGSIVVKLYNFSWRNRKFKRGDKVIQLVILPILTPELERVDELADTERGSGGFGSTGR
ncbi:MAG: dUTP diphosphatase [Clostridia bacterium]|nr:dUTP diphosphatase [Clostridia bacterium]